MPAPKKERLKNLPSYALASKKGSFSVCHKAHASVQLALLAVLTFVLLSTAYRSFANKNRKPSSSSHKSALESSLDFFKSNTKQQQFQGNNNKAYVPPPISKYPQGNRSILVPQEPLCNSAYQTTPWVTSMPADSPRPHFLHVNTSCEGASERMAPVFRPSTHLSPAEVQTKITLALFYYQDMQLLSRQVQSWMSWPLAVRHGYEFIIIDDGSQAGLRAMDFLHRHAGRIKAHLNVTVYEVEQDLKFNMGGVRNLAHAVAETDYVLALDTDVYTNGTVAEYLLQVLHQVQKEDKASNVEVERSVDADGSPSMPPKLRIWKFLWQLMPDKVKMEPHPAVMLSHKQAYWAVGGCDEDLVGNYGQTDILLLWKADRDEAINVISLTDDMKAKQIFVQKWWKREKRSCHPTLNCPVNLPKPERPPIKRILKPNMDIFQAKRQKKANFSTSFLRFGWHRVADF